MLGAYFNILFCRSSTTEWAYTEIHGHSIIRGSEFCPGRAGEGTSYRPDTVSHGTVSYPHPYDSVYDGIGAAAAVHQPVIFPSAPAAQDDTKK